MRGLPQRRSNRLIGYFYSIKTGKSHLWVSRPERSCLLMLELDPTISNFEAQQMTFEYYAAGRCRKYTPDAIATVNTSGLKLMLEVKRDRAEAYDELWEPKKKEARRRGYELIALGQREINANPYYSRLAPYWSMMRVPCPDYALKAFLTDKRNYPPAALNVYSTAYLKGYIGFQDLISALHREIVCKSC